MDPLHRQAIVQGVLGTLFFVVLIFWPAGTFDYWQGWLFLGIFAASTVGFTVYLAIYDRPLLERRLKAGPQHEREWSQKIIVSLGVVCVDAFPVGVGEAGRAAIRKMFRRWRFFLPLAARFGLAARMTADQHADVNIEGNDIAAASVPVLDRLTCPVRFVLATGDSLGTKGGEMEQGRDPVLARNPNLKVSAKVASNHNKILRNDSPAVAHAVRETAAAA